MECDKEVRMETLQLVATRTFSRYTHKYRYSYTLLWLCNCSMICKYNPVYVLMILVQFYCVLHWNCSAFIMFRLLKKSRFWFGVLNCVSIFRVQSVVDFRCRQIALVYLLKCCSSAGSNQRIYSSGLLRRTQPNEKRCASPKIILFIYFLLFHIYFSKHTNVCCLANAVLRWRWNCSSFKRDPRFAKVWSGCVLGRTKVKYTVTFLA